MSIKFILMLILLVAGMGCIMSAKVSFQKKQLTTPDNVWSEKEKQLRKIGYGILIADVILAGFIPEF